MSHTYKVLGIEGLGLMNEHPGWRCPKPPSAAARSWSIPRVLLNYPTDDPGPAALPNRSGSHSGNDPAWWPSTAINDAGESISIADPQEAWVARNCRPRSGRQGSHLGGRSCSRRPRSAATPTRPASASFPGTIRNQFLFSDNVESFAVSKGWYDPKSGSLSDFMKPTARPRRPPNATAT